MATILVCEDTAELQMLMKMHLTKQGHDVLQAMNGKEALELVQNNTVGLIITDMVMPMMDGFELIEENNLYQLP